MKFLWLLGGLLPAAVLCCLRIVRFRRIRWNPESFPESTEPLPNPNQGFYHIFRYELSDDPGSSHGASILPDSYPAPLALLEINLKQFRSCPLSEKGLARIDRIFSQWAGSPHGTKLILRFLYDWDGLAMAAEPESLSLILTHMDQICPIVNRYSGRVFLMQGIFIGNWGEMHHSRFSDARSVETLIRHLHDRLVPSVFLSVRTPAQWRMVNHVSGLPAGFPGSGDSLMGRLGLYNDGILGSVSDLGTYGGDGDPAFLPDIRERELAFQNRLCRFVPNGGEAVYHPTFSQLDTAVSSLRAMRVSYLNADYDQRVLDRWRKSVWRGKDAFYGCDGYRYVESHLGYRYGIRSCAIKKTGLVKPGCTLVLTLENSGFSSTLKPFQVCIVWRHTQTGVCTRSPVQMDLRELSGGERRSYPVKFPAKKLAHGRYQVYLSITEGDSRILLGNKNEITDDGYYLGQLDA